MAEKNVPPVDMLSERERAETLREVAAAVAALAPMVTAANDKERQYLGEVLSSAAAYHTDPRAIPDAWRLVCAAKERAGAVDAMRRGQVVRLVPPFGAGGAA